MLEAIAASVLEGLDDISTSIKHLICLLRYGHIWHEIGAAGERGEVMWQCGHCTKTVIINMLSGELR